MIQTAAQMALSSPGEQNFDERDLGHKCKAEFTRKCIGIIRRVVLQMVNAADNRGDSLLLYRL